MHGLKQQELALLPPLGAPLGALQLAGGVLKASLTSVLLDLLRVVAAELSLGGRGGVVRPSRPDKNKQRDQGEKAVQRVLHKNFSGPILLPPDA